MVPPTKPSNLSTHSRKLEGHGELCTGDGWAYIDTLRFPVYQDQLSPQGWGEFQVSGPLLVLLVLVDQSGMVKGVERTVSRSERSRDLDLTDSMVESNQ